MSKRPPDRDDVITMLAAFGDRGAQEVAEQIGSLELTWLISRVEQDYGITLDLSDADLARMTTVSAAVHGIRAAMAGAGHG